MKTICASWAFLHSFINSGIISKYMSPNTLHMSILSVFLAFTWRPHSMWNIFSCAAASNKCYYTLESPFFFFCFSFLYVAVVLNCPPHAAQRHLNMEEWQNKKIEQIRSVTNENNKQFSLPSDRGRKKTNNKRTLFISFFYLCVCSIFLFFPVIFLNAFFLQFTVDQRLLAFVAGDSHTAPHRSSTFFRPRCITALGGTWHIP